VIVCDNASANEAAIKKLNEWKDRKYPEDKNHQILPVYCFAHVVHRVVSIMLPLIRETTEPVRAFAKDIHTSSAKAEFLRNSIKQKNETLDSSLQLSIYTIPSDVRTRWNSTHQMIAATLKIHTHLGPEFERMSNLSSSQISDLVEFEKFLRLFASISQSLTRTDVVTVSQLLPSFNTLFDHIESACKLITDVEFGAVEPTARKIFNTTNTPLNALYNYEEVQSDDAAGPILTSKNILKIPLNESETEDEDEDEDDDLYNSIYSHDPYNAEILRDLQDHHIEVERSEHATMCETDFKDLSPMKKLGFAARLAWFLLRKHYNRTNDVAMCSLALHPHFNKKYFYENERMTDLYDKYVEPALRKNLENYTPLLSDSGDDSDDEFFDEPTAKSQIEKSQTIAEDDNDSNSTQSPVFTPSKRRNAMSDDITPAKRQRSSQSNLNTPKSGPVVIKGELDRFIEFDRVSRSISPYVAWQRLRTKKELKYLYPMAMDYLIVPATSVSVERLFSMTGLIFSQRRTRMLPITLVERTSVGCWLRHLSMVNTKSTKKVKKA
jgi:hypothetical protein